MKIWFTVIHRALFTTHLKSFLLRIRMEEISDAAGTGREE